MKPVLSQPNKNHCFYQVIIQVTQNVFKEWRGDCFGGAIIYVATVTRQQTDEYCNFL